ncbi:hypothetical protein D3C79_778770 [compost metagenome]
MAHRVLPGVELGPVATHGHHHQQREAGAVLQGKGIDAVADAARLHQQGAAFAAQPGAGQVADAFFFGGEHNGLDIGVSVGHADGRRVAGIRDEHDMFDVVGLEDAEHVLLPVLFSFLR